MSIYLGCIVDTILGGQFEDIEDALKDEFKKIKTI